MKIRSILAAGVAASVALVLTGCTGGDAPTTENTSDGKITGEITFQTWSLKNDKFSPYFQNLVKEFEKQHEGVKVKWIDQPADGYGDKILQQAESGELPDVVNLPPEFAHELALVKQLVDLKTGSKIINEYVEGGLEAYSYDSVEGIYAFPWYLGTELNYWNMALLKKGGVDTAPTSVNEMLDTAEKLAEKGEQTIAGIPGPKTLQVLLTDQGAEYPFMKDGDFVFDTPEAVALVERYADLYKKGAVSPEALQNAGVAEDNVNIFNKGNVAWTTAGPGYIDKNLAVNAPKLLPDVQATSGFGHQPLFVQGISVSAQSKNPATALAFAEFVTNDANQIEFMKLAQGFFPGTIKANEDPTAFADTAEHEQQAKATDLAAAQMSTARVPGAPGSGYVDSMEGYGKQQIALAIRGDISAKEALQKTQNYANENASK